MCRLSYTLIAGALVVLATLLKDIDCFTLHRFDQSNDDPREVFIDTHQPATATGIDDEFSATSQDRLFKRSAPPAHQLTAAEWQLLLQQMIGQHNVDSSDEVSIQLQQREANVALLADDEGRVDVFNNQRLDDSSSDELLDDDQSWDQVKDAELLKKFFGVSWESVKDMKFDHTSTEDLIEDWLRKQNQSTQQHLSS